MNVHDVALKRRQDAARAYALADKSGELARLGTIETVHHWREGIEPGEPSPLEEAFRPPVGSVSVLAANESEPSEWGTFLRSFEASLEACGFVAIPLENPDDGEIL